VSKLRGAIGALVVGVLAAMIYVPSFSIAVQDALGEVRGFASGVLSKDGDERRLDSSDGVFGAMPTPTARSQQILSAAELDEFRKLAVSLINQDRVLNGLDPVVLGTNTAAQLHAEDMLRNEYLGDWWVDGRKPNMVYSETGGTSYIAENAAIDGWTSQRWDEEQCDALFVDCRLPEPAVAIRDAQWGMVYDDAHADWGHRDNILGQTHRSVNLGIAWNGRLLTFVQHFEGGDVEADGAPLLEEQGNLSLSLNKVADVDVAGLVTVYYDPLPSPRSPGEIGELNSYCVGGGFTTNCAEPVARILKPLDGGRFYPDVTADEIIAAEWTESRDGFSFRAALGSLAEAPGVYTVHV
jgi:hypothetical protein